MIKHIRTLYCWALLLPALSIVALNTSAQLPVNNSITQITDGIYRGSNGIWHNLIYVTPEGILLVDTLNVDFSTWLKQELASLYPELEVKYVVYSHSHFDHAEGGYLFADTATFIAQSGMARNMDGRYPNMPGDMIDRNQNGMFEPEDFQIPWDASPGVCGYPPLDYKDLDGDGSLTPAEFFADVKAPDLVYDEHMTLHFGGQTIELIFPGLNHADDMTVAYFPAEKVLFAVDFLVDALARESAHALPSACGPFDGHSMDEWIASYQRVEAIDFDILTTGHGIPVRLSKQDVVDTREFFEYLQAEVAAAIAEGQSLAEMQDTILLEPYQDWDYYELLRTNNIEAAYKNLMNY